MDTKNTVKKNYFFYINSNKTFLKKCMARAITQFAPPPPLEQALDLRVEVMTSITFNSSVSV